MLFKLLIRAALAAGAVHRIILAGSGVVFVTRGVYVFFKNMKKTEAKHRLKQID